MLIYVRIDKRRLSYNVNWAYIKNIVPLHSAR